MAVLAKPGLGQGNQVYPSAAFAIDDPRDFLRRLAVRKADAYNPYRPADARSCIGKLSDGLSHTNLLGYAVHSDIFSIDFIGNKNECHPFVALRACPERSEGASSERVYPV
jgi:hypothetical protein